MSDLGLVNSMKALKEVKKVNNNSAKLTNGLQLGSRIALMSDSIGQSPFYVGNPGGNNDNIRMRGETWIATASIHSGGLIRIGINAAVAGNTTQQMLDRIDTDLGLRVNEWDTLTICGGVNDALLQPTETAKNIEAMAIKALQWGKNVIFCTLFPANAHNERTRIRKINYLVSALAAKYHAPLIDFHNEFLDPVTGGWKTGLNYDSIHPNLAGVNKAGKFFADKIKPLMQTATSFIALDNLDTRVLINGNTFNPLWLIDSNGDSIPDGFSVSANPGGYVYEFSNNPTFDADAVRCKITSTGSETGSFNVNASFLNDKWAVGDLCQVALKIKFIPGTVGIAAPKFTLRVVATGSVEGYAFQQELQANHNGIIVSEPFAIPNGTTAFLYRMEVSGGAFDTEFSRPTLINLTKQGMI
ncbi:SGNH/GDSL hydrolase family protein [Bacillus sp. 3103sda1]|uniref:SGNH/GDSL hydrolase family protein n=1 Tax=Bacillus sp. 3103sda1 TaxID=2953808 RepID=UPI00209E5EFC|nr:SGNH/GDSL hydrolase family protein [Bacillus sp. 3103sda1]MCP1124521.1 SGNH/GDSL hydrolase family protein [Bacillus sp. 3103sda1]